MTSEPEFVSRYRKQLDLLKKLDPEFKDFGASNHRYSINSPLSLETVEEFERVNEVSLPQHYRDFFLHFGDGGAGPGYGIFPLSFGFGSLAEPGYSNNGFFKNFNEGGNQYSIMRRFRHIVHWNPLPKRSDNTTDMEWELLLEDYLDNSDYLSACQLDGSIAISATGCGHYYVLVITGEQAGTIWSDERSYDNGIKSCGISFQKWYENWLFRDSIIQPS